MENRRKAQLGEIKVNETGGSKSEYTDIEWGLSK